MLLNALCERVATEFKPHIWLMSMDVSVFIRVNLWLLLFGEKW